MNYILFISGIILMLCVIFILFNDNANKKSFFRRAIKILFTNWIHLIGIFFFYSLTTLIDNSVYQYDRGYSQADVIEILFAAPITLTILTFGQFGMIILFIFVTDLIAFALKLKKIIILILTQWIIISSILEYIFIVKFGNTVFAITLPFVLLLAQILRAKLLKKVIDVT